MTIDSTPKPSVVSPRILCGVLSLLISLFLLHTLDARAENAPTGGTIPPPPPVGYWISSEVDSTAHRQRRFDVAVDDEGKLHVVYVAFRDDHEVLMYAKGKPGAWSIEEVARAIETDVFRYMPIGNPQIVLDGSGTPHVAYWNWIDNSGSDKLHYAHKAGNSWSRSTLAGVTTDKITPYLLGLTLTSEGNPLIVTPSEPVGAAGSSGIRLNAFVLQDEWEERPIGGQFIVAMRIAVDTDGTPCVFYATNEHGIGDSLLYTSCYRNDGWSAPLLVGNVQTYNFDVHFDSQGYLSLLDSGPIYGDNPRQGVVVLQEDADGWESQSIYRGDDAASAGNFAAFEDETLATSWATRSDVGAFTTSIFYAVRSGSMWQSERAHAFRTADNPRPILVVAGATPYLVGMLGEVGGLQISERIEIEPTSVIPLPLVQVAE